MIAVNCLFRGLSFFTCFTNRTRLSQIGFLSVGSSALSHDALTNVQAPSFQRHPEKRQGDCIDQPIHRVAQKHRPPVSVDNSSLNNTRAHTATCSPAPSTWTPPEPLGTLIPARHESAVWLP